VPLGSSQNRKTVAGALHQLAIRVDASDAPRVLSPGAVRTQAVVAEPMPNGGLAEPEAFGDLASRETLGDEGHERVPVDASLRRMTVAMNGR
jgi:hypothetical protein